MGINAGIGEAMIMVLPFQVAIGSEEAISLEVALTIGVTYWTMAHHSQRSRRTQNHVAIHLMGEKTRHMATVIPL